MHVLRLTLETTKQDCYEINRRFHALSHVHNVLVKRAKKLLASLRRNEIYQSLLAEYRATTDKAIKKQLSAQMSEIRMDIGLTEYGLQKYATVCAKQFRKMLSSSQIQKEATSVYKGVDSVLFGKGNDIHFKKFTDFDTINGKNPTNGVVFDKKTMSINWLGLHIPCKYKKSDYINWSVSNKIKYCSIQRLMFNNSWHYYVIITLDNDAPMKFEPTISNTMGIDPGVSIMAGISDNMAILEELAPNAGTYEKKIYRIQQVMDRSKRASNPNKFNPDGTIVKNNKERWVFSHNYYKLRRQLRTLYRKKSAYIKQCHFILAKKMVDNAQNFIVEKMNYAALARRVKKTERQDTATDIKKKDGTTRSVRKYKKKKRFGRSIGSRAPAMFLAILQQKCIQYGGTFSYIDTKSFKASQYNHDTDEYIKVPLSQRTKIIDGVEVQRDLYSAFLVKNSDDELKHADREKCLAGFDQFVKLQNELIENMKTMPHRSKCFGF